MSESIIGEFLTAEFKDGDFLIHVLDGHKKHILALVMNWEEAFCFTRFFDYMAEEVEEHKNDGEKIE